LYDYIMVHSEGYKKRININHLELFLSQSLGFIKDDSVRFSKELGGEFIRLTGILANSNGNYAFDNFDGIEEINLIEIDVPERINPIMEEAILHVASTIANEFAWIVDLRN